MKDDFTVPSQSVLCTEWLLRENKEKENGFQLSLIGGKKITSDSDIMSVLLKWACPSNFIHMVYRLLRLLEADWHTNTAL